MSILELPSALPSFNAEQSSASQVNPTFDLKKYMGTQTVSNIKEVREPDEKTVKATQDFEAFFIGHLLKDMRASLPKGGLFPESGESRMMQDMLDENMADNLAHKGPGIGLSKVLLQQLKQSRS